MIYDVIIVGAGPAGAVLAYKLAKNGFKVLVLEKENLPRYKTCGGGLTLKTLQALPFDVSDTFEVEPDEGELAYNGQFLFRTFLPLPFGAMVMRSTFDHYLMQKAIEAGAHLRTEIRVTDIKQNVDSALVHTEMGNFTTNIVVGADGVNSQVAGAVGLLMKRRTGIAIEAEIHVPDYIIRRSGQAALFDFGAIKNGYGWIFPKQDHLSVGLFQASCRKVPMLKQMLSHFINQQQILENCTILHLEGHRIPLGGDEVVLHKERVLLIGDAANLADPWMGEGIYYAVQSATIAADVIRKTLEKAEETNLRPYTAQINSKIIPHFLHANRLANIVYRFPYLCSRLLQHSSLVQKFAFGTIRGTHTFHQLERELVRQSPRILTEAILKRH
jgi:geranylgeranyl reductase family protein